MNVLNKSLFTGFLIADLALLISILFPSQLGFLAGHAAFVGWFLVYLSIIVFLIGASLYLLGRMKSFWRSLYPINFGLALLGWAFIVYNTSAPVVWVVIACVAAPVGAFILHKIDGTKSKWVLLALIVPLFIESIVFWTTFIIGLIFISLSLISRVKDSPRRMS